MASLPSPETATSGPDTRTALVLAAIETFSRAGYEGVSLRDIERRAGVNRGLVAYHFGSKEALWEAAMDLLMERFHAEMERYRDFLPLVSEAERGRVLLKIYVNFAARNPQFFRLLVLEGESRSERAHVLVDQYLRRLLDYFYRVTGVEPPGDPETLAIDHFMFTGAASMIFAASAQCEFLFGVDPTQPAFIDRFADLIANMGYPMRAATAPPEADPAGSES
jgi:TetR/AcrR family transcriptional regulator